MSGTCSGPTHGRFVGTCLAVRGAAQMRGERIMAQNRREDPVSLLVLPAGAEDPEMRLDDAPVLQRDLCSLLDEEGWDTLVKDLESKSLHHDVRRLNELRDPTVNHDWLWSINPVHRPVMADRLFAPALRTPPPDLRHTLWPPESCVPRGPLDSLVSGRFLWISWVSRVAACRCVSARVAPRGPRDSGDSGRSLRLSGAAPTAWTGAGRRAVVTGHRGHLEDFGELTSLVMTRKVSS